MKNRIITAFASLLLLVIISSTSSCTVNVAQKKRPPRHRQRTVWIGETRYKQVYYVDSVTNNVIIVNQSELPGKPPKHHGKRNKHK